MATRNPRQMSPASSQQLLSSSSGILRLQYSASNTRLGVRPSVQIGIPKPNVKPLQSALSKRFIHQLIVDGVDRTPRVLVSNIYSLINLDEKQQMLDLGGGSVLSAGSSSANMFGAVSSSMFVAVHPSASVVASAIVSQDDASMGRTGLAMIDEKPDEEKAPSAFCLPIVYSPPRPPSFPILIKLRETPTVMLFDRPSITAETNTSEAEQVEQDNFYYSYITTGKGKNRKVMNAEVQTMTYVEKTRSTNISRCRRQNDGCFTTAWMMYDTFMEIEQQEASKLTADALRQAQSILDVVEESQTAVGKDDVLGGNTEHKIVLSMEEQYQIISETEAFKDAVTKMERALASNVYQTQQKFFKGLLRQDPYRLDVEYKYTLTHLWSFTCEAVKGRCVTAICWSKSNKNLLAVGYGKYYYEDIRSGIVCCWSLKNPSQPERMYRFDSPVTHLDFSTDHPNLLAIAFYDGSVIILDIVAKAKNIIVSSSRKNAHYEPVWQVIWYHSGNFYLNQEQIMTAGQDGVINRYRRKDDFASSRLMRVSRVEGVVKGIEHARRCRAHDIPISRFSGVLVLSRHPQEEDIYYVGTDEGYIHKCSKNYLHQHLDLFLAHLGPIYTIEFSPFCGRVFLSCGADWCVRIWAQEVAEPLITLTTTMDTVQCAAWSPINATVIASISGTNIHMWDIRRKTFVPASTTPSPSNTRNTVLQFTESGENLLVGDVDGGVHVFGLTDMPFSPFFQEDHLISAIKKALITRPDLLKTLKKTGKPF